MVLEDLIFRSISPSLTLLGRATLAESSPVFRSEDLSGATVFWGLGLRGTLSPKPEIAKPLQLPEGPHMSYSLNSLKGAYVGDYMGEY